MAADGSTPTCAPEMVALHPRSLDVLMPMHLVVDPDGRILRAGPTLAKVHPGQAIAGRGFFEVFALRRPRHTEDLEEICFLAGGKFYLRMRDEARTPLIGTAVCLGAGQGVLVNLSFGIAVIDAVARFRLAGSDFAATDLTLEMLYLVEAKSAAMAESRKLNERLHGAKAVAEAEALRDTLTGLHNRRALDGVLERLIERGIDFTLMHLDLDFFKRVNDTLGHEAGDVTLRAVAHVLLDETREQDIAARVGGDEFILVFKGLTDKARMMALARRLIERIEQPVSYGGCEARVSASIGIAVSTDYAAPAAATLMRDADFALYASKGEGRGRANLFTPDLRGAPPGAPPGPAQAG